MSDLEQELAGVLAQVAEGAPGVTGLAEAARRRHRVRRRRRLAVGAAAAAVVVGMGAVVVGGLGDDERATDPTDGPVPKGWQTVGVDGGAALVSIPSDWSAFTCDQAGDALPVYGPSESETCAEGVGVVFLPEGMRGETDYGAIVGTDGGSLGYVLAGEYEVRVFHTDRDLVRHVLSTARVEGDPVVDGSRWVSFERDGMDYEVPAWWGLGKDADLGAYSACFVVSETPGRAAYSTDDSYVLTDRPGPGEVVRVTAPTQALAELVMATVDSSGATPSGDCATEDFSTGLLPGESTPGAGSAEASGVAVVQVEHDGVTFSVLDGWREKRCGGLVQYTPGSACQDIRKGEGIQFLEASSFEPAMDEGALVRGGSGTRRLWAGYVLRGDFAVLVVHADKATAQTLLDLIR